MLTRDEILARSKGEKTVDLPGGGQVRIRALSRNEVMRADQMAADDELASRDDYIVATALVEPQLSIEDVRLMGEQGSAGDLVVITEAIAEISGLKQGAPKSGVPPTRKRRRG